MVILNGSQGPDVAASPKACPADGTRRHPVGRMSRRSLAPAAEAAAPFLPKPRGGQVSAVLADVARRLWRRPDVGMRADSCVASSLSMGLTAIAAVAAHTLSLQQACPLQACQAAPELLRHARMSHGRPCLRRRYTCGLRCELCSAGSDPRQERGGIGSGLLELLHGLRSRAKKGERCMCTCLHSMDSILLCGNLWLHQSRRNRLTCEAVPCSCRRIA